jgi:hypothetical protein
MSTTTTTSRAAPEAHRPGGLLAPSGPRSPAIGYPQVCDVLFSLGLPVRNS